MEYKICKKCKESKNLSDYYKQPSNRDGFNTHCKSCVKLRICDWQKKNRDKKNEYNKRWKRKDPKKARDIQFKSALKCHYGISLNQFQKMQEDHQGNCGICKKKKKLLVDHCHKTGRVRGLLCYSCNTALGMFKDSKILLDEAIKYLGFNT